MQRLDSERGHVVVPFSYNLDWTFSSHRAGKAPPGLRLRSAGQSGGPDWVASSRRDATHRVVASWLARPAGRNRSGLPESRPARLGGGPGSLT